MPEPIPAPPSGTIAYAEWKRKQQQPPKPGNQESGKLGRKEAGKETSQEVVKEARKEASQALKEPMEEKPVFKASFLYTEEEMELFEDLKLEMRRKHGLKVTKNDLARSGIRLLAEDYRRKEDTSFLVKASQAKPRT